MTRLGERATLDKTRANASSCRSSATTFDTTLLGHSGRVYGGEALSDGCLSASAEALVAYCLILSISAAMAFSWRAPVSGTTNTITAWMTSPMPQPAMTHRNHG